MSKKRAYVIIRPLPWSGIEVVITALTRNQVYGNVPWVRIPPAPHAGTLEFPIFLGSVFTFYPYFTLIGADNARKKRESLYTRLYMCFPFIVTIVLQCQVYCFRPSYPTCTDNFRVTCASCMRQTEMSIEYIHNCYKTESILQIKFFQIVAI